jgi:solute carrier family 44 protein 1 (choline transporter-like protein)/choline transporter-like protein 2/4/5
VIDWRFAVSFFSFLWNCEFLVALGQLIVAGACAVWFFAPRGEKGKQRAVKTGIRMAFRYHMGSLAFGSLLIAMVQFVRYTLMYLEKQSAAAKNRVIVLAFKVIQCCLWCFEKCLKFSNKNAYIQIALVGKNFCTSAKAAFFLIFRNMARFGAVAMLGTIINYVGILFITAGSSVLGYFILKALHPDVTPVLPIAVYVVTAYIVSKLYMNVFSLAVDTMLQCFIATEEMGGDTGFVPEQLQSLLPSNPSKD